MDDTEKRPTCISCGDDPPADASGYCKPCQLEARREVTVGMRRFGDYLAAWAAFDEWLHDHGRAAA